jgi:cell division protein FtsB
MAKETPRFVKRVLALLVLGVALVFAVQGGEFGTLDLVRQKQERARVNRSIDSLAHIVDSLKRYANAVQHDAATQERIAREVFGMVRGDKEILYRFTDRPDSAAATTGTRRP